MRSLMDRVHSFISPPNEWMVSQAVDNCVLSSTNTVVLVVEQQLKQCNAALIHQTDFGDVLKLRVSVFIIINNNYAPSI